MRKFLIHNAKRGVKRRKILWNGWAFYTEKSEKERYFYHLVKNTPYRRGYIIDMWPGRSWSTAKISTEFRTGSDKIWIVALSRQLIEPTNRSRLNRKQKIKLNPYIKRCYFARSLLFCWIVVQVIIIQHYAAAETLLATALFLPAQYWNQ